MGKRFRYRFSLLSVVLACFLAFPAMPAHAAVSFTLRPLTWDDIGLDSNNVNTGPNVYEIGLRACNTGNATANTVTATWAWTNIGADSTGTAIASPPGPYVDFQTGTSGTQLTHYLAAGSCFDFYFNMQIVRTAAAYNTTRNYTITVDDGVGDTATDSSRIAIEGIQSQNRNYVAGTQCSGNPDGTKNCGIYGSWNSGTSSWNAAPTNVLVGSVYTYTLVSTTATGGYGSYSTMLNFPRGIFEIESVQQTYTSYPATPWCVPASPCPPNTPTTAISQTAGCCQDVSPSGTVLANGTTLQPWANACNWQYSYPNTANDGCTTGAQKNYKAGNLTITTYSIKIIQAGSASITGLVWDGSGASWHYNSDYGTQVVAITATNPWAATLVSGQATPAVGGGVEVTWTTGMETDNLGFNIYALQDGSRVQVNPELIAGSAFGVAGPLGAGHSYSWLAPPSNGPPASAYEIEAVATDGSTQTFGPFALGTTESGPAQNSPMLAKLGSGSRTTDVPARTASGSGNSAVAAAIAQGPAVKISVDHEGWYSVPLSSVAAAGVDVSNPSKLHLYAEGVPQALRVVGGSVEFYGLGLNTPSTGTRVYWLTSGKAGGPTIPTVSPSGGAAGTDSYPATVERRDHSVYFASLPTPNGRNFFGSPVTSSGVDQNIDVTNPAGLAGATVRVSVQGVTQTAHSVDVQLNGNDLGQISFQGQQVGAGTFPATGLTTGANTVRLTSSTPADVGLVDRIAVHYRRTFTAQGDSLDFTAPGGSQITVGGFVSDSISVADVTNPASPVIVTGRVAPDGSGGYEETFTVPGKGTRTLYAFAEASAPASVLANQPSHLRSTANRAQMVIIAAPSMVAAVDPLAAWHTSRGLSTKVVSTTNIYDEFGYGEKGPQPIRDFVSYAMSHWATPPSYLLLAGDASLDPRNYLGKAASDLVPTKMVPTTGIETASDNWLAGGTATSAPRIAIGRLPADTSAQMQAMVAKTIAYAKLAPNPSVVVPYDGGTDFNFAAAASRTAKLFPSGMHVSMIDGASSGAHTSVMSSLDQGPSIVDYVGHGSVDLWRNGLFSASDASALTDGHPSFLVAMTCLNGYFIDPALASVSESMLEAPSGSVAVWASTGYTYPSDQRALSRGLYGSLFSGSHPTVGQAARAALISTRNANDLLTWTLFGDPALMVR
jgi:hypothetical protein